MKSKLLAVAGLVLVGAMASMAQDRPADVPAPQPVKGKVVSVTAYRGQAMVTRAVPVPRGTGLIDVVVSGLPDQVFGGSLFADGGQGIEVRAVRFRTRVVGRDVSREAAALQQQLEDIAMRKRENAALTQLATQQLAFLDKLETFVAPTATVELSKGVLNAETIEKLTKFSFEKRAELVKARLQLGENTIKLGQEEQDTQRKLALLGGGDTRVEREAVVFLDKRAEGEGSLSLSYLVGNVNWRPSYNLRAESGKQSVKVEYSAIVNQMSGEDWHGVELTLSTASPALIARGATLLPMYVSLVERGQNAPVQDAAEWNKRRGDLKKNQQEAARSGPRAPSAQPADDRAANEQMERDLNRIADEMQKMELEASGEVLRQARAEAEGVSVEYRLPGSTGLASRADQQLVKIADLNLKASFAFVGTPVLSDYVYLEAEATNDSETVLLEGSYTSYLDGRFVGRSVIPLVGRGESFGVGFGIDSQLRVSRDVIEKKDEIKGGNRLVTYKYRLTVANYKSAEVVVRLMERIPAAPRADIRINLAETSEELSKDRLYLRDQRPKGVLRWDVKVPKGATGADTREVTYTYTMEYDKQMDVAGGR
ncbi:MAG: mucoidy inhibitor MuiA family protein [Planctomycetaceae bacterium]|nr:mucoidy inhibitor MuiA family protein [Planctomycetaceae bacterium]